MYKKTTKQMRIAKEFHMPLGGKLNRENRWVKLADIIPWDDYEEDYLSHFKSPTRGQAAYSVRVALGALIIQAKLELIDEDVPRVIMENPYLQYFLGFSYFEDRKPPFDPSMLTRFRQRLGPEVLIDVNEKILLADQDAEKDDSNLPIEEEAVPQVPKEEVKQLRIIDIPK